MASKTRMEPTGAARPARGHTTLATLGLLLPGLLVLPGGVEAKWTFTPRVSVTGELTDNANLSPRGDEEWDFITSVNPGFNLRRDDGRLQASLSYGMNNRFYARESGQDRTTHRLAGTGTAELIREAFFVEATALRTEQADSLLGPVGVGGSTPRENLRETTRYSISPYLITRYGRFATQQLRYRYSEVLNHRSARGDSHTHAASYQLNSGPAFNRPFWQLAADYREERFDDAPTGEFGTVSGTAGYQFSRFFSSYAQVGREYNNFETLRDDEDDTFWEVGATWTPTRATSIQASYGERFFGKNRAVTARHASRRADYRLSYSERITSTQRTTQFFREDLLLQEIIDLIGDGAVFDDDGNLNIPIDNIDDFIDEARIQSFFFVQSWRGAWQYRTGRSTFRLSAFHTRRQSETDITGQPGGLFESDRQSRGGNASWTWALGPRTDTTLSARFSRSDFADERQDDLWGLRAAISRQLTPDSRATLTYRHQQRESDERAAEYRENALLATFTREF